MKLYFTGCPTAGVRRTLNVGFSDDELALNELDLFVKSCDAFRGIVGNIEGMLEKIVSWYKWIYKTQCRFVYNLISIQAVMITVIELTCRKTSECWIGEVEKLPISWRERKELVSCIQHWNTVMKDESRK